MSRTYSSCRTARKKPGDQLIAQFEDSHWSGQEVIDAVTKQLHRSARQLVKAGAARSHGVFIDIVKYRPGVYLRTYASNDSQE